MSDYEPIQRPAEEPHNMVHPVARGHFSGMPAREAMKPLNGLAIISFWLMFFWFSIPAIIVGHTALYQLSFTGFERGKGWARAGVILAYLQVALAALFFIFVGVHIIAAIAAFVAGFGVMSDPSGSADGISHLLQGLGVDGSSPTPGATNPSDLGIDPSSPEYKELLKELEKLAQE
jgi:hypothetical protein